MGIGRETDEWEAEHSHDFGGKPFILSADYLLMYRVYGGIFKRIRLAHEAEVAASISTPLTEALPGTKVPKP